MEFLTMLNPRNCQAYHQAGAMTWQKKKEVDEDKEGPRTEGDSPYKSESPAI